MAKLINANTIEYAIDRSIDYWDVVVLGFLSVVSDQWELGKTWCLNLLSTQ